MASIPTISVTTCTNDHELGTDGCGGNADTTILGCSLAENGSNLACQHCTEKYFSVSAVTEVRKRILNIQNSGNIRRRLIFKLKLLRDIGELVDRLRAYGTTHNTFFLRKIDEKYPKILTFLQLLKSFGNSDTDFIQDYEELLNDCIQFLQSSVKILKQDKIPKGYLVDFLTIKTRRDAMLRLWLEALEKAEQAR